ncbi:MAG: MFS transporter [Clostridia bacterium]
MEEKKKAQIRKSNMKLYPIYKMVSLDWLFFYGIEVLFLMQVKHFTASDIVLASSIYAFFCIIVQIPVTVIIGRIGKRRGMILGNLFTFLAMVCILLCKPYSMYILARLLSAIGFGMKGIAESNFLTESLPETKRKSEIFSKIDGGGYSKFCYVGAISVFISGFLYDINPYIPIVICLMFNAFSIIASINFIEITEPSKISCKENSFKNTVYDLKNGFHFIFQSARLKALLCMLGFIWGIIILVSSYQETQLKEMQIPSYYIGIILATTQLLTGIFATKAISFHKQHRNKTLTLISLTLTISAIILGTSMLLPIPFSMQLGIVLFTFIVRSYSKGIYQVVKKRYLGNFTNAQILPKIYAANSIISNMGRMVISLIGSMLLRCMSLPQAALCSGIGFTMVGLLLIRYMKNKVGLKPEAYPKKDIEYVAR